MRFKEFILYEAGLLSPQQMKSTFDSYFKGSKDLVSYDSKNKNRLKFFVHRKSTANEIIATIDSIVGFKKNNYFTTSPITQDYESKGCYHFDITFKPNL